ncbi:sterol desaturase family protein [Veronia pacifica]|uniref:Fatty acid hydroxylase domain-containing protein n=1 Tax=Veronia pacifica TaxID=1080227 RepID=A0A1C3ESL5_9GAMM|nr:sterol desaturase family protein [Veronia pacifica]ODA36221.1 hypothetical protein A8L45_01050 [Veronia pacifica]
MTFQESLFIAVPSFVLLISIEFIASRIMKKDVYPSLPDVISSLSSGLGNITFSTIGLIFVLVPYDWLVARVALFDISSESWLAWIIVILLKDFSAYWIHRWNHKINGLWQLHLIHHSSEEFNLPVALRQPVNGFINYQSVALIPAAIMGIPTEMVAIIGFVHLFYQYWYHTQLIGSLGWLEYVIMTPQQHSIHHAMNKEYMDKNFGAWFSIWDQMFGTFQLKISGVEEVYGVTQPVETWNPIKIDFMHWTKMMRDSIHTKKWSDKFGVWYKSTNWRPDDVAKKFPSNKIEHVSKLEKFDPKISLPLIVWSTLELGLATTLVAIFFLTLPDLSATHIYVIGGFILLNIATYTTIMEGKKQFLLPISRVVAFALVFLWGDVDLTNIPWLQFVEIVLFCAYVTAIWVAQSWNEKRTGIRETAV